MDFNESPQGQKSIGIIFPHLVACSTFYFITWFQIFKLNLSSLGNRRLYSTTVWRQACIYWYETKSRWTLNKWWSKLEKWWGFPAICPINPPLLASVLTITLSACQRRSPGPCSRANCHSLRRPEPRDWSRQEEGCRGPKSWAKKGCFICRNACFNKIHIFNKMITEPLKRMKFHQLQQNG